jgi:Flp pilus assembly pilin Flp
MHTVAPQSLFRREDGQTMAEYAIVLATIVLAAVATIGLLSGAILSRFETVLTTIKGMLP